MLSFLGINFVRMKKQIRLHIKKNRNIAKSLQVPCSPLFIIFYADILKKRVLPFTLRKSKSFFASMTVEAAIVLPLFIFCAIAVLSPLEWLDTHRKMQTEAEQLCEKMSLYAYMLGNQVEIADEEGNIIWNMERREKIPFFHPLIRETKISVLAKRRGWIGLNGKLKSQNENFKINENEEEEEMVYVGMGMTRYHPYRDCHYLHNKYQEIPLEQAQSMKKDDGRRLSACASCAEKMNVGSIVYITEYGCHYHSSKNCKAMVTYVRKVPLSKVSHLGECSACKKRGYGD